MKTLTKWTKRLALFLVVMFIFLIGFVTVQLNRHPDIQSESDFQQAFSNDQVRLVFAGTSSLLVTDGRTQWCLDCFLSRPSLLNVMLGKVEPDPELIQRTASRLFELIKAPKAIDSIFVAHSHYDHSMDAAFVANQYGAKVVGSESTRFIAIGHGLDESKVHVQEAGEVWQAGEFRVKGIFSSHAPTGFTGGENLEPLVPPTHALNYKEGTSYAYAVWHGPNLDSNPLFLVQPSAGFRPNQFAGLKADVIFLATAGLGKLSEEQVQEYWNETVVKTGARKVYLIHWDDFTEPLFNGKDEVTLVPLPFLLDDYPKAIDIIQKMVGNAHIDVVPLPAFKPIAVK